MNSLKMEKYCANKCRYEWLHDISKRLRDIFFRRKMSKNVNFKWFDSHCKKEIAFFFVFWSTVCRSSPLSQILFDSSNSDDVSKKGCSCISLLTIILLQSLDILIDLFPNGFCRVTCFTFLFSIYQ